MREITVDKSNLLEVLKKNRTGHRAIFEEALEGYRKRVVSELQSRLDAALSGVKWDACIELVQPEDHTIEYDRAIQMLEMDIDSTVKLSSTEFQNYVQDEWGWTDRFLTSNASYSRTAERGLTDRNMNTLRR